jgi:penicillin amidase
MLKAKNLDEYRAALEHWYAPGANALYGDADGHIAYHALLGVPERSTESEYPGLHGRIPYDGTKATNDWKGPLSVATRPNVVDPEEGYLFSGNHMVVGSWYPHYTGMAGAGDTDRSLRLRYLLAEKLHEASGSGPAKPWDPPSADAKLSPADVLAIHGDSGSDVVRILRDALAALDDAGLLAATDERTTKAKNVLGALRVWKDSLTMTDPVTPLASFFAGNSASKFRNLVYPELACVWGGGQPGLSHFLKDIDRGAHDVATHPASQTYLVDMAAAAWDAAGKPGDPSTWPVAHNTFEVKYQANFFCQDDGSMSPCPLDDAQSFSVPLDVAYVGTILSQPGNSYSQLVDFSAIESSRAVMPPGASENPESPWFDNQLELWKAGELAPAPTALDTVIAEAVESVELTP